MHGTIPSTGDRPLRIGSLFSGYGGLDLAIEHVFGAETIWFSEMNEPVAGVFAHHWPDTRNLGDMTTIDWSTVPPEDFLCGGFPCQDVSTAGRGPYRHADAVVGRAGVPQPRRTLTGEVLPDAGAAFAVLDFVSSRRCETRHDRPSNCSTKHPNSGGHSRPLQPRCTFHRPSSAACSQTSTGGRR